MSGRKTRAPRGGDDEADSLTAQLSQNPALLAALQAQLGGMVGGSSGYVEALAPEVHARVSALRRLQVEHAKLDNAYYKEVRELELKFAADKQPLLAKRAQIISGAYEPTEEEAKPLSDDEEEPSAPSEKPVTGVPDFWLTVLHADNDTSSIIEEYDNAILQHLQDIFVEEFSEPKIGYRLVFVFGKNEYFKNERLVKTYYMDYELEENQVDFSGPSYSSTEGCEIDWYEGKNVTVRVEKKKQKKKGGKDAGKVRTITKTVPQPSFFSFFNPPRVPEGETEGEEAEMIQSQLSQDFQIGDRLRDHIIPNAVLFFTGELVEDDDDQFGEGDFGEDDDNEHGDGDEDDDDDEEAPAPKSSKGGKGPKGGKPAAAPGAPAQNPECKQQ